MSSLRRTVLTLCVLTITCTTLTYSLENNASEVESSPRLGSTCIRDDHCQSVIANSRCHLGHCRCQPFFAEYNGTNCLESTLLGNDCTVDPQCSMKVANSSCLLGVCRCDEGFLQFRRHTCVGPAKPGAVCYAHAHCRLWDRHTHCDFLIPDLFGRCQCTAPMRREGDVCKPDALVRPVLPGTLTTTTTTTTATSGSAQDEPETGVQLSWLKNTTSVKSSTARPNQTIPMSLSLSSQKVSNGPAAKPVERPVANDLPEDSDAVVVEAEITELVQTTSAATPTKADRHEPTIPSAVTLGLECFADIQCRLADPMSRCIDGVCDCFDRNANSNSSCGARKTGCAPGTFQCRSTGNCVSWFFVCDGRPDCADRSDEECSAASVCPPQAFRCGKTGGCVSRARICDGRPDCPNAEDEEGCNNRNKCPEGAFRCNNGQCLPAYEFCNAVVSCRDGSDEPKAACRSSGWNRSRKYTRNCPFRCGNGRCRSDAIVCSGRDGCGDGSDEKSCSVCTCSGAD